MSDDSDLPSSSSRGLIPSDQLPFARKPLKWRIWIPLIAMIAAFVVGYFIREERRAQRERSQLLREHAMLTESLAPPYQDLRRRIEALTHSVLGPWQGTFTEDGLRLSTLTSTPLLYGRVRIPEIHSVGEVARSIRHRYPDQIASCLGLESAFVHQFYSLGDFLMPAHVDAVRAERSGDRLRVLRDDLQFRLRRDTANIVDWSRRRYFVLAVDEAAVATAGATRVYVWDLTRNDRLVLRARGEGNDTIIVPITIAGLPGAPRAAAPSQRFTQTEHDCAIAGVIRAQLGEPPASAPGAADVPPTVTPVADGGTADSGAATSDASTRSTDASPDAGSSAR